jgi:hypothetical protein
MVAYEEIAQDAQQSHQEQERAAEEYGDRSQDMHGDSQLRQRDSILRGCSRARA